MRRFTYNSRSTNIDETEEEKNEKSRKRIPWPTEVWVFLIFIFLMFFAWAADQDISSQLILSKSPPAQSLLEDSQTPHGGKRHTIAWAVTVSKDSAFIDGAAVLQRAVELSSISSAYNHAFVAITHPEATKSRDALKALGWLILETAEPVVVQEIQGSFLKSHILKSGCCGARELLKLYAWTLTSFHRVVHLDMDSLVLGNMDELFALDASLVYTCDYNMMNGGTRAKLSVQGARLQEKVPFACPVQGGFAVIRPSQAVFDSMVAIVKKGDFNSAGWGGTVIGGWWGGATFQGVVPYYYATQPLLDGPAIEVDRCIYNNMVDKGVVEPPPLVGASECRATALSEVKNVHFTLCQKPWECQPAHQPKDTQGLCLAFHTRWHSIRASLEAHLGLPSPPPRGPDDWTRGHCQAGKYVPLALSSQAKDIARTTFESPANMKAPPRGLLDVDSGNQMSALGSQKVIAWAITVSLDGPFLDGAAVLYESIRRVHPDSPEYRHEFVALVHPNATRSMRPLRELGWKVVMSPPPVAQSDIQTEFMRKHAVKSGCCGLSELIKLYAWTLTSFHRVVHLDMDSLVLGNMDELFALDASLVYTCDYNMMPSKSSRGRSVCPVQGGFVVVRPDMGVFEAMVAVVKEGRFGAGVRPGASGWNGTGIGHWWGGATFQGVVPFFYHKVADRASFPAVEVDRCVYDNMVDDPIETPAAGDSDCRAKPFSDIKNAHFTLCQKPWKCSFPNHPDDHLHLCAALHSKWFDLRQSVANRYHASSSEQGSSTRYHRGACKNGQYSPIAFPPSDAYQI